MREQMEELATLSDTEIIEIWMTAPDPEHPTPREEAALSEMEARNLDF